MRASLGAAAPAAGQIPREVPVETGHDGVVAEQLDVGLRPCGRTRTA